MSYDKARSISLNRKANKIMVSIASSNVVPKTYYNCEYMENSDKDFEYKLGQLLRDISGGNIHLNTSLYKWNYAINKTNIELGYGNCYSGIGTRGESLYCETKHKHTIYYIGKKPYCYDDSRKMVEITQEQADNENYILDYEYNGNKQYYKEEELQAENRRIENVLNEYSSVFMKYFEEKCSGKYYLYSPRHGIIKPKGTNGAFYYYYGREEVRQDDLMDYYKAYCLAINCSRDNNIVEVRKYEE